MKSKELKSNWEVWVAGHKLLVHDKTYYEAIEEAEALGTPFAITQKNYTYKQIRQRQELEGESHAR